MVGRKFNGNKKKYDDFRRDHQHDFDWVIMSLFGMQLSCNDAHHILSRWPLGARTFGNLVIDAEDFLIPVTRGMHMIGERNHPKELQIICLRILIKKEPEKKELLYTLDPKWKLTVY